MLAPPTYLSSRQYVDIFTRQIQAIADNERARANFLLASMNWITRNADRRGRQAPFGAAAGDPEPEVPKMKTVSDTGEESEAAFPDLAKPVLPPPLSLVPSATVGFFGGATIASPADRIDQLGAKLVDMLAALHEKFDKLLLK